MKIVYFDCFSGISGDMTLGALLDAGLSLNYLKKELKKLPLANYEIETTHVEKEGIVATKVHIYAQEKGIVRTWPNIKGIIEESNLDPQIKKRSQEIFLKLAQAEAKIHRKNLDQVHFHEVGATDSIIDIVGTVIGLHHMNIKKVYSSEIPTGFGMTRTEHGITPIPAPTTLEILKDTPIYSQRVAGELTTPTGAAIIKTYAQEFGPAPSMEIETIGYGAGSKDFEIPNLLRVIVGKLRGKEVGAEEEIILMETNIDDMNPELYTFVVTRLLEEGALDVWMSPTFGKKNRPALVLSLLSPPSLQEKLINILFQETSTLGVRIRKQQRKRALREIITVKTKFGSVRVKIGKYQGKIVSVSPEYEDCVILAKKKKVPLKEVYKEAEIAARQLKLK